MTSDEARAQFDAALDLELDEAAQRAFDEALARDAALADEFAGYRSLIHEARTLGREVPAVDLLAGVQHKLRARSGGRFYRDRFATRRGKSTSFTLVVGLSVCVVLIVLLWLAYDAGMFAGRGLARRMA